MDERGSDPTPEQQLLKLIEQPDLVERSGLDEHRGSRFSLGALRGRLSFLSGRFRLGLGGKKVSLGIRDMSRILVFMTLVLAGYLGTDVVNLVMAYQAPIDFPPLPSTTEGTEGPEGRRKPFFPSKDRDIFAFGGMRKAPDGTKKPVALTVPTDKELANKLAGELQFKGMMDLGSGNITARIKDRTSGYTKRLKVGETINTLEIVEIQDKKVIAKFKEIMVEIKP